MEAVGAAVVGLDEDALAHVHEAVAHLALEADVGDLAVALIGLARAVAVERVAVGIGVADGDDKSEVYFVLES